jgi:ketosteroid isomerase-like protein
MTGHPARPVPTQRSPLVPTTLRQVFDTHMRYLAAQDLAGLVSAGYADDAVLVHNFPYFPGDGPWRHCGRAEILGALRTIFAPEHHGAVLAGPAFEYLEHGNTIAFQLHVMSPTCGRWMNTDLWTVHDGRLAEQYMLGYPLDEADVKWKGAPA